MTHGPTASPRSDSASELEESYIAAMSRPAVVSAYAAWGTISEAERLCLDLCTHPKPKVLDLGCGAGRLAGHFLDSCELYVGVDASKEMVGVASEKFPSLRFFVDDIVTQALPRSSFDVVLLMHNVIDSLHPIERRVTLLHRCHEWLLDGGVVVISSHLTREGQKAGYYSEDYHGVSVSNYRSSLDEFVEEIEAVGYVVDLAVRDYRGNTADWAYLAARSSGVGRSGP